MAVLWDAALEVSDEMTSNARCWFRKYRPLTRKPREGRNHGERDYNRGQVTSYIAVPTLLQCPRCHFNTHQEQKSRGRHPFVKAGLGIKWKRLHSLTQWAFHFNTRTDPRWTYACFHVVFRPFEQNPGVRIQQSDSGPRVSERSGLVPLPLRLWIDSSAGSESNETNLL